MFLFAFFCQLAMANSPQFLIQAEGSSSVEYNKFLLQNSQFKEYSQSFQWDGENTKLEKKLVHAQLEYLEGSMNKAHTLFTEIAKGRFTAHWGFQDRERIQYALFRLAQIAPNPTNQKLWLQKALAFDPEISPDSKLFPPPVVEQWKALKALHPYKVIVLPEHAEKFNRLVVNGKEVSRAKGLVQHHGGEQKISFFSNTYQPVHLKMNIENMTAAKLPLIPVASGTCQTPKTTTTNSNIRLFFSSKCLKNPQQRLTSMPTMAMDDGLPTLPKVKQRPSFWKRNRTLLWLGASAIGALATWQALQSNRGSAPIQSATASSAPPAEPTVISND